MLSKDEYSMGIPYLHSSMRQRDLSRESMNKISNCSLYLVILSWTQVNSLCLSAFLPREVAVLWGSIFDSSEHVPNFVRRISTTKYFPLRGQYLDVASTQTSSHISWVMHDLSTWG